MPQKIHDIFFFSKDVECDWLLSDRMFKVESLQKKTKQHCRLGRRVIKIREFHYNLIRISRIHSLKYFMVFLNSLLLHILLKRLRKTCSFSSIRTPFLRVEERNKSFPFSYKNFHRILTGKSNQITILYPHFFLRAGFFGHLQSSQRQRSWKLKGAIFCWQWYCDRIIFRYHTICEDKICWRMRKIRSR